MLLTGPSGAGKSRLAGQLHRELGWPVLRLDDFYRELGDPGLPRSPIGIPDWDHPDSWNEAAAVEALATLVTTGAVEAPVYDIASSSVTGHQSLTCGATDLVIAEGLFAARLVSGLREAGLLHSAFCIAHNRWVTAARRFARDLSERRKPPLVLVRRGWALLRDEPQVIARAVRLGARCVTPAQAYRELREGRT